MENLKTILFLVVILLGLPLLIVWLNDKIFHRSPSKAKREEYSRRFEQRLLNPDFPAVEACVGCKLPDEVKKLYANKDEICQENFEVVLRQKEDSGGIWTVAFYLPADMEEMGDLSQDGNKLFPFANDGCGNEYLIDPRASGSEVVFHDHETGEFTRLGVNLTEFLSAPRKNSTWRLDLYAHTSN
jgi:hypothetical protein